MWLKMTRISEVPVIRAASTKSSSRSERKRPRTTLARPVQPSRAPRLEDVAATAAALSGATIDAMAGEALLER